jgi:hypothetical protein
MMTKNEMLDFAKQAGLCWQSDGEPMIAVDRLEAFAKLVAAKERELCKKECMEQFELSLSANEKAKSVRDKEAYLNSAIGAKYCLMRIEARGEA